ncbi:hypothetical protein ACJX0J_010262, partial [Zea mays]
MHAILFLSLAFKFSFNLYLKILVFKENISNISQIQNIFLLINYICTLDLTEQDMKSERLRKIRIDKIVAAFYRQA